MDGNIEYSEYGLQNRMIFLSDYNDINIIVEDEGKEFEYEQIFDRMLGDLIKINHIFPMKGKDGVIKAYNNYGETYGEKKVFYLVDGDFDLIMNKVQVHSKNFIYLQDYNIEDYFIDKKAVISFLSGKLKKTKADIEKIFNFEKWESDSSNKLIELFICFIVIQLSNPTQANVSEKTEFFFINPKTGLFDKDKITQYIEDKKQNTENFTELYNKYLEKYKTILNSNPYRLICGKYLLKGLSQYIRLSLSINFRFDDFRFFLITKFNIHSLDYVKEIILTVST